MSDYNTGQATILGSVNVSNAFPVPTSTQTLKCAPFTGTGAMADIFTATAGKTAYVTCIVANQGVAAGAVNVYDNADALIFSVYLPGANYGTVIAPGTPFIKVLAGQKLKQNSNNNSSGTVFYFEVTN